MSAMRRFDLLDRTPNIEEITKKANNRYLHACELPYEPGAKVVDKYMEVLKSAEFRSELTKETLQKRMDIIGFRQRSVRASAVNELNKYIS